MEASTPPEVAQAPASSNDEKLTDELYALRFSIGRSVRYHRRRAAFFEHWTTLATWASLLAATSTAGTLLASFQSSILPVALSLVVVALNLFVLSSGFQARQQTHRELARRYAKLSLKLKSDPPSPDLLRKARHKRTKIEAQLPHRFRLLDTICHNDELRSEGFGPDQFIPLKWYHRWIAHYADFDIGTLRNPADQPD